MPRSSLIDIFQSRLAPARQLTGEGSSLIKLLDDPQGWERFLRAVGGGTFTQPFGAFHAEFWDWYWRLTKMRRDREKLSKEILTFLAGWGRGMGKSSMVEWACIAEGAMGLDGYVLYISLTQTSANTHVAAIKNRLESEDISRYFPDLSEPQIGKHSQQYGWRQDFLMTKGGWAIRPVGLDAAIRGFKEGDLRPSLIVFDDIDSHDLTIDAIEKNLGAIARSILPSGTPNTIHLIAQNLITEQSAVNQIYMGKTDILSDHIACIVPAFEGMTPSDIEKVIDETTGKSSYVITSCVPSWEGMDVDAAKINLNKSGLEAFFAEYQHDFTLDRSELVVPEFDEDLHVITWPQFQEMFRTEGRRIPTHWQAGMGLDIGYTADHQSAWTWICVSAEDSDLPFTYFIYRGTTFTGKSLDEQVTNVLASIRHRDVDGTIYDEREQYVVSKMSHEKLGERMVLNREYAFNFSPCSFGKEDGVPQWRSLLRCDRHKPHPFHQDAKDGHGRYIMGRPTLFYIVDEEQATLPRDDHGLATHRAQTAGWRRRRVKLTDSGVTAEQPQKYKDDACFVFSTLIGTKKGDIPIGTVVAGDMVMTRFGYRKVLVSSQTGIEPTYSLDLGNRNIKATNNHPLFTKRGWVVLGEIKVGDEILCQEEKSLSLTERNTTATLIPEAFQPEVIFKPMLAVDYVGLPLCMSICGNLSTEMYLKAVISITQITTLLITYKRILSAYLRRSIESFTGIVRNLLRRRNVVDSVLLEPIKLGGGPRKRRLKFWRRLRPAKKLPEIKAKYLFVQDAGKNSRVIGLSSVLSVATPALNTAELISYDTASGAESKSTLEKTCWSSTVWCRVESGPKFAGVRPVYNLSVDEHHEYFANGVLASNCDSVRMLLAEENLTATPLTQLQRRRIALKEAIRSSDLTLQMGNDDYGGVLMRRQMEIREIELAEKREQENIARAVMHVLNAPSISPKFRRF